MAAKGITVFIILMAVTLSISVLAGVGFFDAMGVDYEEGDDEDVQAALDALTSQGGTDTGGSQIVDFTTGAANSLQTFWAVISNTSGLVKLLFGLPNIVADSIEIVFQIVFGITFLAFIRGVLL